ncbi:MAG: WecB/TagA/CpsF family glycosyltransferase [bacterium]|nr:WecB/TagA/CpsF family glycosyltransferase [bacterium]
MLWTALQRTAAAIGLVATSPILLLIYLAAKLLLPGPFLFRQQRRGLDGREFCILKIRTMQPGGGPVRQLGVNLDHPSIPPFGRLLRDLKLDELPQLWNVMRGDMALVGPRPLPIALDDELRRRLPGFQVRERVRPGLTSIGQLLVADNGVGNELTNDWHQRAIAERHYVQNRTWAYDLLVLGLSAVYLTRKLTRRLWPNPRAAPGQATAVLGVPISNADYGQVVDRIADWRGDDEDHYVCVCPVHSVVEAQRSPEHMAALQGADLNTADGMPVVWAQRLLGNRNATRVYGPDLTLRVLARAAREGWRVGFYGSSPRVLEALTTRLQERFEHLQIGLAISPPFRELTESETKGHQEAIRAAQLDVLFVGLGCPRQERWMARQSGLRCVMIGVGAAFDFHAGSVRQCPPWLQRTGLEWLFRLAMEPRRLFWRYFSTNPAYLIRLAGQLVARLLGRNYQRSDRADRLREVQP